jgi:hypothetical protein
LASTPRISTLDSIDSRRQTINNSTNHINYQDQATPIPEINDRYRHYNLSSQDSIISKPARLFEANLELMVKDLGKPSVLSPSY